MSFDPVPLRRQFPILAAGPDGRSLHYLDNASVAQMPRDVIDAMAAHEMTARASVHHTRHPFAARAAHAFQAARAKVARFLNADDPAGIAFAADCTTAIARAAAFLTAPLEAGDEIVLSALEHQSNRVPWLEAAAERDLVVRTLPLDAAGRIDEDRLSSAIGPRCRVVAVTHASNITGALSPVRRLADAAHAVGATILVDGAQMPPHGAVDVRKLGIDCYCFSGQKVFGPTGIGVLWANRRTLPDPQAILETGAPPQTQAVGLATALSWLDGLDRPAIAANQRRLVVRILDALRTMPEIAVIGPVDVERRIPLVSFTVPGRDPDGVCRALGEKGIAVGSGSFRAEAALTCLGVTGVVRVSLALYNNDGDVDAFLSALTAVVRTA